MRRIFIALLLTVIVYFPGCNREAFSRNPSLRFRLIGTWTTLFAEVIPKEVTYPKDRNPWVEIQFSSTLEITGDTVYIAVSSVNDSSRGVFTVACEYELASDTLTLLVTRYQNPPRIVREPYQIS
ncbi:MAG TPA: hypothetical protein VMS71_04180, partial [Candidatus Acidoferrum sp.]|nr:hypothetical protein [Candidatus Acidoferrum sp.]